MRRCNVFRSLGCNCDAIADLSTDRLQALLRALLLRR
jgi:hypothetical protein